ncbi:ABC transporter substrate-binding protein [Roseovarius aestuarii]|uniref:Putative D,D-dipeptide-binding periplasmic protein DdpA n=1 Tax=Roseovarius aestuarii TaxID=475083 RepID=A0A1X7BLN4_9RHOB|nr:ABC transporter substrate-binding protein [Roseovarius aestuarii]SMC10536.1 putative D,D-dipeptide-binding periplasmic protein DdpA precursor [Roseovarius aestuarii]
MDAQDKHAKWLIGEMEMGRMSRREFLGRSTAIGLAMGVGTGLFDAAHAATPKKGGHMRLAMGHGATSDTLDPATIANGLQWVVSYGVANTLTELDAQGNLVGALATEWSSSPDAKVWTFKLRDGVEFHNGKTMTTEDVIASLNYHRGEESTSVGKPVMDAVTEIKADGNTIVVTLASGNADFPFNFNEVTFGIYPAKDNGIDWQAGGSGGYILKNEQPGQRYEFERNPNYWKDGAAHADTIDLQSITDPAARQNALITGEVDCIDRVELKTLSLMERNPNIVIEEGAGPLHYTFPMLTKVAPFDNVHLRKALKYSINRQDIVDKILFGHGVVGNDHPIGPSYRYHAEDIEQLSYDPDKARHHYEKSGLGDIEINLSASDAAYSGALDAAVLFQASAKAAGININVVREPNDGYWSDVWMNKPWSASYWGGYSTEDTMLTTGFAPGAAWNDTQWDHPRFNELLVSARAELDEGLRAEMYREIQVILRDEGGNIVPMFANEVHARNDKIAHGDLSWVRGFDGRRILERWWMV